ncbi:MAG: two-component sensor histidine kinase [Bacteroidetes bacterium]|nr:MAG: two-component sensor histidine kinase [Bacteroidota bacterium]
MYKHLLLLITLLSSQTIISQNISQKLDSIVQLRKLANDENTEVRDKIKFANKAYELSKMIKVDTTILKSGRDLSYMYVINDDYENYQYYNHKNLKLATKLKDTLSLANINEHLAYYHYSNSQYDSSYYYYYQSIKLYNYLEKPSKQVDILYAMANMQETEKDYAGSEKNAVQALQLLEELPETNDNLITSRALNNLLAVISERLDRRQEAIEYYNKTLEISKKIDNSRYYYLNSLNNLAFTIEGQGELNKALEMYNEILSEKKLVEVDPDLYVIAIGNVARVKFMLDQKNTPEAKKMLFKVLHITDSLGDDLNKMGAYGFLADIYYKTNQKDSALYFSKKTYELATELNSNIEKLESLKLLGQLESGQKGIEYLNEHIKLSDSLLKNERKARDKFTRIEFETDQIIAERDQISKERLIFLLVAIGLFAAAILIYIIINQRAKNKQLRFNQMQQEANEEIYNLMLAQQDKIDEGRSHEKKRISKELHDGILGKLFGTRLSLDSLNMVATNEAVKTREKYLNGLKDIEEEIRKISHDLSNDFVSDSNFVDIISALIQTQSQAYNLEYTFDNDASINWEAIPNKTKIHVYRMLQETLQNIYKHAKANLVKISFKLKKDVILILIEDDGTGFNVSKARKGIGLKNIDSRIKEMGGIATVFSEIGKGTKFEISIPTV